MAEREEISIVAEIAKLAAGKPFRNFAIVMLSGRQYDVTRTVAVAIGRQVIILTLMEGSYCILQQNQVSELMVD